MPFAVIGVLNDAFDAKLDDKKAWKCLKDNIHSKDEADAFMTEANAKKSTKDEFFELFIESHPEGEAWKPRGGRCFFQALSIFTSKYADLIRTGYVGDNPRLVHGYGEMINPERVRELSAHAWVEGDKGFVFDCGSYIPVLKMVEREEYHKAKKITHIYSYSLDEAKKHWEQTGYPFPWDEPPPQYPNERVAWEKVKKERKGA